MIKKVCLIVASSFLLFGCASQRMFEAPKISSNLIRPNLGGKSTIQQIESGTQKEATKPRVSIEYVPLAQVATPTQKIKPSTSAQTQGAKQALKISVENMPLNNFIKLIFGKILKSSYFMGRRIQSQKTPITLKMTTPMTKDQFLSVVLSILKRYGVSVKEQNGIYYITASRNLVQKKSVEFFVGRSIPQDLPPTKRVGVIVPLYYINASKYAYTIRQLTLSRSGYIGTVIDRNDLIIIDTPTFLNAALKFIKLFDRPMFEKRTAVLLKLSYISPTDFVKKISSILPLEGIPIARSLSSAGIILKPLEDLSSVFILSPKKEWINIVEYWKNKLDTIEALGNQPHLFVYYPKNRRATELAKVFKEIEQGTNSSSKSEARSSGRGRNRKKKKHVGSISVAGFKNVKVVVDESRNALVILCSPSEYKQVKATLEKLDTLPKQVFVQVSILEVTLTGKLQYGLEWYLRHSGKFNGVLQTTGGLGLGSGGLNYTLVTDTAKFMAMINAFAQKNLINVLSSPSLVVMDNKDASINVGTQVPVVTSESTGSNIQDNGTTALVRTIQYRNTGVILHIKPTINSNGIVTLDVSQEVSDAQTNNISPGINSPLILTRDIQTSVTLKSGSTLLLGGLIKKSQSNTVDKVPLLGDLPLFGNLFKTTSKGTTKTELIVEITPYILPDMNAAEKITKSYRELMDLFKK